MAELKIAQQKDNGLYQVDKRTLTREQLEGVMWLVPNTEWFLIENAAYPEARAPEGTARIKIQWIDPPRQKTP